MHFKDLGTEQAGLIGAISALMGIHNVNLIWRQNLMPTSTLDEGVQIRRVAMKLILAIPAVLQSVPRGVL